MTGRVYLLDASGDPEAVLEAYESLSWSRSYWGSGRMALTVNRHLDNAELIETGRVLLVEDVGGLLLPYYCETHDLAIAEEGRASENVHVTGVEYGLHEHRVCLPPPYDLPFSASHHVTTGPAETALLELVDVNIGPSAVADRRLTDLALDTDLGRGVSGTYQSRFQPLSERLTAIAQAGEVGWEVVRNPAAPPAFLFRVIVGQDRTASVFFDVNFESALAQRWFRSLSDFRNVAYVAGQGEGLAREVEEVFNGAEPTGRNRREMFVDARDVETGALTERGLEKLAEQQSEDAFTTDVNPIGSFRYPDDWDLGDLVTLRNPAWGITRDARIIEIELRKSRSEALQINVTLGKALPSLRDRVRQEIGGAGTARS